MSAAMGFFLRDSRRIRNSHGKRPISVRATVLLIAEIKIIFGLHVICLAFASQRPDNNEWRCVETVIFCCCSNHFGIVYDSKTLTMTKFHGTDLVICSHSRGQNLSYSQIIMVRLSHKYDFESFL